MFRSVIARVRPWSWSALLLVAGCGACKEDRDATKGPPPKGGWYRVSLTGPEVEIPFFLHIPTTANATIAEVANGDERVRFMFRWDGDELTTKPMVFPSTLSAQRGKDGVLRGTWHVISPFFEPVDLKVTATPIEGPDPSKRFLPKEGEPSKPAVDLSGKWWFEFEGSQPGNGVLEQKDNVLTGTIMPATDGDFRFLAGNVFGNRMVLSAFDGIHAYVLEAHVTSDGKSMEGTFKWTNRWVETFKAKRVDELVLHDPLTEASVKPGSKLDIPELDGPPFAGNPVVIELFATWCPNCADLTPLLVELHDQYHPKGLEVLGLNYELTMDVEHTKRQLALFEKRFKTPWKIVIRPSTSEDFDKAPPLGIRGAVGYPTTIWLKRDHTVHAIYSGYSGPATGELHTRAKATFERLTREIVEGQ
jgi:thiol-disulfide isomerase/thioredoxin